MPLKIELLFKAGYSLEGGTEITWLEGNRGEKKKRLDKDLKKRK
jgi:hypothetical protein